MRVIAGLVLFWCTIALVASDRDDFNGIFSSYSPGVIQDVRHVSEFPVTTEDGYFLNEILQPPTSDQLTSVFPMPYEVQALLERSTSFSIRILNSSWSALPNTNVIHKGEPLYVQVSASPGPGQQLYVQSCHVSPSPNPSDKAEVAFIINKGCVASKTSPVKFVHRQSDKINLVLGTSDLKSPEVHLHCRVSLSYLGLTSTTKFCNYNKLQSRWVDLSGQAAVCRCCSRSCRSNFEHEDSFLLTAVVSTGPLVIKDQQSETTPPSVSDYSATEAKPLSDKRLIMAGASFSGNSFRYMPNTSPWPVSPGFGGGVMVISQGLGGALSMLLPGLMDLQLNPAVEMGIAYPESPVVVELSLQDDDPFKAQNLEEEFKKWQMGQNLKSHQMVEMDEGKAHFEVVDPYDGAVWNLENVAQLYKVQGEPFMTGKVQIEQPKLNEPFQMSDLPPLDEQSSFIGTSPSPVKVSNSVEDEDNVVFRQAEMTFRKGDVDALSEPLHYSKLSLNKAADGSSSLHYEEQTSSMKKNDIKINETSQKDKKTKEVSGIKDLVLLLLDGLRGLWH